jgi:hypothetical protein
VCNGTSILIIPNSGFCKSVVIERIDVHMYCVRKKSPNQLLELDQSFLQCQDVWLRLPEFFLLVFHLSLYNTHLTPLRALLAVRVKVIIQWTGKKDSPEGNFPPAPMHCKKKTIATFCLHLSWFPELVTQIHMYICIICIRNLFVCN